MQKVVIPFLTMYDHVIKICCDIAESIIRKVAGAPWHDLELKQAVRGGNTFLGWSSLRTGTCQ